MSADVIARDYPDIAEQQIIRAWRGSVAHGMWDGGHPNSIDDKDQVIVLVPPLDHYCGLREFGSKGTKEVKREEWDIVCYEATKAIRMLKQGNPNILAMLWLPDASYGYRSAAGRLLIAERQLFVGQWVYQPFVGYAKGQLHKMTHQAGLGYLGAKRKELVQRYGYDCKNAAHLIRLLRMACEFLKTGELLVDRGSLDATELLDIKHGEWSLQQVEQEAARLFRRAEDAFDRCTLPQTQDDEAINELCVNVVGTALTERGELHE